METKQFLELYKKSTLINQDLCLATGIAKLVSNIFQEDVREMDRCDFKELKKITTIAVNTLSEREKKVIVKRYSLEGEKPRNYREISSEFLCNAIFIKTIEKHALEKLKMQREVFEPVIHKTEFLEKQYKELLNRDLKLVDSESAKKILIEDLDISVRTKNSLLRAGIKTVQDILDNKELILNCKVTDKPKIRNIGQKSLQELIEKLTEINIPLE